MNRNTIGLDAVVGSLPDGPGFTKALFIPETASQVTAVLATYNRCPFDPAVHPISDNPLTWALDSLLAQPGWRASGDHCRGRRQHRSHSDSPAALCPSVA